MSLIITKEALKILAMNNASCKVFGEKRVKNLKYLTDLAREQKSFDYDELVRNLPESGIMYGSIASFSKVLKKEIIDQEVILKFLGGKWHIEYVGEQTDIVGMSKKFGEEFVSRFIFSHILIVAELTEISETISAKFSMVGASVEIRNLIKHPFVTSELIVGQKVLLHQALILETDPSSEIKELLDVEQSRNEGFLAVVKKLKCIDYDEFWDMKKWTEEIVSGL